MKKDLILLIPCTIAMFINILCMGGKIDASFISWGFKGAAIAYYIDIILGYLLRRKKLQTLNIYAREKSSPKKTTQEVIMLCIVAGYVITLIMAYMFAYNK